jgi:antitoxin component of MazEF toxin-antitoxin module
METEMIATTRVHMDRKSPGLIIRVPKRLTEEIGWEDMQQVVITVRANELVIRADEVKP